MDMPIWARSVTSHSSTPPSRKATVTLPAPPRREAKKVDVKPQMHICRVGQ